MQNAKLLIVDDDPEVVRLLRGYLTKAGYSVLTAHNGNTALQMIRQQSPDLVLLDLMLPDRDGWEITRIVRSDPRLVNLPLIMLTARVDDADKIIGLELGADDYVTKPFNPREVVARVRARLRIQKGVTATNEQLLRVGDLQLDLGRRELNRGGRAINLTPTEFDLLHVLMEHAGYVMTRRELIRRALGSDYEGLERTLDSHMRNLRRKVEQDAKNPQYIHTVYGVGYRMESVKVTV